MIKIRIGGWPFRFPQRWEEVSFQDAKNLYYTKGNELQERLYILARVPKRDVLKLDPSIVLAAYEIISFIEEVPLIVPNTSNEQAVDWVANWTFAEFEAGRQLILKQQEAPALAMAMLAEIKDRQSDYLEYGAKALDGIFQLLNHYNEFGLFSEKEPSDIEFSAGIERLQLFGTYAIVAKLAKEFGKLPQEIEQEPAGWVLKEWAHMVEQNRYQENYARLSTKK